MVWRFAVRVTSNSGRRGRRGPQDRGGLGFRGGRGCELTPGFDAKVRLGRTLNVVAESGGSQKCQRDYEQDDTYPHQSILVSSPPGVKQWPKSDGRLTRAAVT